MKNAEKYYKLDKLSQELKIYAEKTMLEKIKKKKFNSILEIGCGDGHFLKNFNNKEVLGIDIDRGMISQAQPDIRNNLLFADILDKKFVKKQKNYFDIVSSNYVFMEMKEKQVQKAFRNIFEILKQKGKFYFVITNPKTRENKFPGFKLVFSDDFDYNKKDLEFKVLLQNNKGDYVDVGIRDYHMPIENYDLLLRKAGFNKIEKTEIKKSLPYSFAVLYKVQK
ncbi:class I SAM-dependent methyltransferase [Candidatus Pacearchaeota archaeon]|nr:class I SAM-dependent methyltransferase [Candidatus Pacearchaeota archaeon]